MHKKLAAVTSLVLSLVFSVPAFAEPMSFRVGWNGGMGGACVRCEWTVAEGEITSETPRKFREHVAKFEFGAGLIMLDSPGGNLIAGIELGKAIRELNGSTSVGKTVKNTGDPDNPWDREEPGICASACVFAFMGGVSRSVGPNDLIGVNQFYSVDEEVIDSGIVQMVAGQSLFHTVSMGVDPQVVVAASATDPDELYWFDREEIVRYGLDNTAEKTEPWKLEPYKNGMVITTVHYESAHRSVAITLFCRVEDEAWRLLVSEEASYIEKQLNGRPVLLAPVITIGPTEYEIARSGKEFERFENGHLFVSLIIPSNLETSGGLLLKLEPYLAGFMFPLLKVSVVLPDNDWLKITKQNCI